MQTNRAQALLAMFDRFLVVGSIVIGVILVALYLWLSRLVPTPGTFSASTINLILALIPNFLPGFVLFALAYWFLRSIRAVREAETQEELLARIGQVVRVEIERELKGQTAFADFGLHRIYMHRGVPIRREYDAAIAVAQQSIDILGFGLRSLLEDYGRDFASWAERAKVRILLLDPEFPNTAASYANQRDLEEKNQKGDIERDVREFVKRVASMPGLSSGRFEIRLCRCLPSINIFRLDDKMFWGPYLIGRQSRNMPTFVVTKGGYLFTVLEEHFSAIWDSDALSRAVPSGWKK